MGPLWLFRLHACEASPGFFTRIYDSWDEMTQRLNSMGPVDWKHVHVASQCELGFSQHGCWVPSGRVLRGTSQRTNIPKEPGENFLAFTDLILGITYHFCPTLLVEAVKRLLWFRVRDIESTYWWEECQQIWDHVFFFFLIFCFWLCWVFVSVRGLSLAVASGGHSSSRCAGLSPSQSPLLRSTGSRRAGSVIVAHGPSCSTACGIFPDQGSNPCPPHWQADSQPLGHQGSPGIMF